MNVEVIKKNLEMQSDTNLFKLLTDEEVKFLFTEVERLQKENRQLRCWKAAYEKTYHQLVELEGKRAASTETDL